jgi:catechol 2,3-dioxygenase-like lactoylglutathione lyase family enzyme
VSGGAAAVDVIGLDHLYVTVSDLARSEAFYDRVMAALGFRKGDAPIGGEPHAHYFNRVLQYTIRPARAGRPAHDPYAPGLHHVCFQVADRAAVDAAERALRELAIAVTPAALYPEYNPDYYAIFFQDPDGIRLEVVARKQARDDIVRLWDRFRTFLNPLTDLRSRGVDRGGGS